MDVNEAYEAWRAAEGQAKTDAQGALFEAVKEYVPRLIGKLKGEHPPELADDVGTEVIMHLDGFRAEAKFSTWVGAIAKNKWRDYITKKRQERELFVDARYLQHEDGQNADGETPVEMYEPLALADHNRKMKVLAELDEVQEHLRAQDYPAFQRVYVEGMTHREAAKALGRGRRAVESASRRLAERVRARMKKVA